MTSSFRPQCTKTYVPFVLKLFLVISSTFMLFGVDALIRPGLGTLEEHAYCQAPGVLNPRIWREGSNERKILRGFADDPLKNTWNWVKRGWGAVRGLFRRKDASEGSASSEEQDVMVKKQCPQCEKDDQGRWYGPSVKHWSPLWTPGFGLQSMQKLSAAEMDAIYGLETLQKVWLNDCTAFYAKEFAPTERVLAAKAGQLVAGKNPSWLFALTNDGHSDFADAQGRGCCAECTPGLRQCKSGLTCSRAGVCVGENAFVDGMRRVAHTAEEVAKAVLLGQAVEEIGVRVFGKSLLGKAGLKAGAGEIIFPEAGAAAGEQATVEGGAVLVDGLVVEGSTEVARIVSTEVIAPQVIQTVSTSETFVGRMWQSISKTINGLSAKQEAGLVRAMADKAIVEEQLVLVAAEETAGGGIAEAAVSTLKNQLAHTLEQETSAWTDVAKTVWNANKPATLPGMSGGVSQASAFEELFSAEGVADLFVRAPTAGTSIVAEAGTGEVGRLSSSSLGRRILAALPEQAQRDWTIELCKADLKAAFSESQLQRWAGLIDTGSDATFQQLKRELFGTEIGKFYDQMTLQHVLDLNWGDSLL